VAVNDRGDALAAWCQEDDTHYNIYARFLSSGSWGPVTLMEFSDEFAQNSRVALNDEGEGVVVWAQGIPGTIYSMAVSCGEWGSTQTIGPGSGDFHVDMNNHGEAIVVWRYVAAHSDVYGSVYSFGKWSSPASLESLDGDASFPRVAMNNDGAVVVWSQGDGDRNTLYSCRYDGAWERPVIIDQGLGDAYSQQVDMDDEGNTMVVWQRSDGWYSRVFSSVCTPNGWEAPVQVSGGSGDAVTPCIAVSGGHAIAAWCQYDGVRYNVYGNSYSEHGWGTPTTMELGDNGASDPDVAVFGGSGVAVWSQAGTVYSSGFFNGVWYGPMMVAESSSGNEVHVAADSDGNTIIVWTSNLPESQGVYARYHISELPLQITSPIEGNVSEPTVLVTGHTSPRASLVINGNDVHVESNGSFSALIPLKDGANTITVVATDQAWDSTSSASVKVTYTNSTSSLEEGAPVGDVFLTVLILAAIALAVVAIVVLYLRTRS
jgi:hypothetical protein